MTDPNDTMLFLVRLLCFRPSHALRGRRTSKRNSEDSPGHVHQFNKNKLIDLTTPHFRLEKTMNRGIFTGYRFRKNDLPFIEQKNESKVINNKMKRLIKLAGWSFLMYWAVRTPLQMFFTEFLGLWYVLSNFLAGALMMFGGFLVSEYWIWKGGGDNKI